MRILLAEDDHEFSELLVKGLHAAGYDADVLTTAGEVRAIQRTRYYAALVFDLDLFDGDGLSVVQNLRAKKISLPILILTAHGSVNDRVKGLRAGADDYLVKPVAVEELIARVEALTRRVPSASDSSLKLGNLELLYGKDGRRLLIAGHPHILPRRDLSILELLLEKKGEVVSKKSIINHIPTWTSGVSENAIEVYVHRLRRTLEKQGAKVSIGTVRGVGYMIRDRS
jgi:DNA-binding response OmpR family regulator